MAFPIMHVRLKSSKCTSSIFWTNIATILLLVQGSTYGKKPFLARTTYQAVFFFETSLAFSISPCKILIVMALVPVANAPDASKYRLCIAYMCVYNLLTRRNDCRGFTPTYCHMKWRFGSQNRKLLLFKGGVVLCTSFREFYCQKILSLKSKRRDSIGRTFWSRNNRKSTPVLSFSFSTTNHVALHIFIII